MKEQRRERLSRNFIGCMATHLFDVDSNYMKGKLSLLRGLGTPESTRLPRPIRSPEVNLRAVGHNSFRIFQASRRQNVLDWLVDPVWSRSRCTSYLQCALSQASLCNRELSFQYGRHYSRRCVHTCFSVRVSHSSLQSTLR